MQVLSLQYESISEALTAWRNQIPDATLDIDAKLVDLAKSLSARSDESYYDHNQYDVLLGDVGVLLDRCLAYRREIQDLMAAAVRQILEYELFEAQQAAALELELSPWVAELRTLEAVEQRKVADALSANSMNPLVRGMKANALLAATVSEKAAEAEKRRQELVNAKWRSLVAYQKALEARHNMDGHPLNFRQRSEKILTLLLEDFEEAYFKAKAATSGAHDIMAIDTDLSVVEGSAPLDSFVLWTRSILRELDRFQNNQTQVLLQATYSKENVLGVTAKSGETRFLDVLQLKRAQAGNLSRIRIDGVGASLGVKGVPAAGAEWLWATVRIYIPDRDSSFVLQNVRSGRSPSSSEYHYGPEVLNLTPWRPEWPTNNWEVSIPEFNNVPALESVVSLHLWITATAQRT